MHSVYSLICCIIVSMATLTVNPSFVSSSLKSKPDVTYEITSGVDLSKEKETTFDIKRSIVGTAEENTSITIYVYAAEIKPTFNTDNEAIVTKYTSDGTEETIEAISVYTCSVSSLGIFSQSIELSLGENTIVMLLSKDNCSSVVKYFHINRKDREIKEELEKIIVIPCETGSVVPSESFGISNAIEKILKR